MKRVVGLSAFSLIFTLTLFTNRLQAQDPPVIPKDAVTKLISYQEVVQVKGTKDELYIRGLEWINKDFKNPEDVTKTRDRDNGILKGISRFKIKYTENDLNIEAGVIEYSFILEFKDGRYRYTFTEFLLKQVSRQGIEIWLNKEDPAYNPRWDEYLRQVDEYVKTRITSLKEGMLPPAVKDDNW